MTGSAPGRPPRPEDGRRGRGALTAAALVAALVALAGCAVTAPAQDSGTGHPATRSSASPLPALPVVAPPTGVSSRKHHAAARAPRASPSRRQTAHGDIITASGAVLPNRARTPGATNPDVTQATIGSTICVSGWTATLRPPSSVTTGLKVAQLRSGYAYRGDLATGDYEEDHLISLELGGAPSDPRNLWPEPYASPAGARVKDVIEDELHALVCSHTLRLATAQHAIATNWWTAYRTYTSSASRSRPQHAVHPPAPAPPTSSAAPAAPGNGATARCKDGSYSYATHHQGACSHHGGVQSFFS